MREVLVCPPVKRKKVGAVHRLQFDATGRDLVAWIEDVEDDGDPYPGPTRGLCAYNLDANAARSLVAGDWFDTFGDFVHEPVVSPDLSVLAAEFYFDGDMDGFITIESLSNPDEQSANLPASPSGLGALTFTADGAELIAVRNNETDGAPAPDVVRFEVNVFTRPPTEFRDEINPLTNKVSRVPVRDVRWKAAAQLPRGEAACAMRLSANGRLVVVGTQETTLHVVDRKRKKIVASFPWAGRKLRYAAPIRVAFDPAAKWVVMLASGRLFARPLRTGTPWHTKETLGDVRDFAFHPSGRVLCAVFADGEARYLDPQTGAVRESFRWSKKPLRSVCFSPDGLTCAAGGEKGRVVLWDVDT